MERYFDWLIAALCLLKLCGLLKTFPFKQNSPTE